MAERQVKGWTRAKKEALIHRDYDALVELAKNRQQSIESPTLSQRVAKRPSTGSG
jgi:hypothetical protein